jgi:hypothetical protein
MIHKGIQDYRLDFSSNSVLDEIKSYSGNIDEHRSKVLLYKYLRNNPAIAANFFLGLEIFPFQSIAIKGINVADYSMLVFPRGGSKSWLFAVSVILRCILVPDSNIGIVSSSFRQAKMIMNYIDKIMNNKKAALARECGYTLTRGTDQWVIKIGSGQVTALPLGDGAKLRGFRFNMIGIDEFMNVPKSIFTEVILPFLGVSQNPDERNELSKVEDEMIRQGKMKEEERYAWPNNKLVLLSSPSYTFQYMYELYKKYLKLIDGEALPDDGTLSDEEKNQKAYRFVMQLGYDVLPKGIYDANLLAQGRATMSEMQFKREFGAQFIDESDGFFRLSKMMECTIIDGDQPAVELKGNPLDKYILSFDPNISSNASADHFAIHVAKLDMENKKTTIIHSYAIAGVDLKEHMKYFMYLIKNFNIVMMCGDAYGGDAFIKACNESQLFMDQKMNIGLLDGKFNALEEYNEDLVILKDSYNLGERKYCFLRNPSSDWIRQANELLQGSIDNKRIRFGASAVDSHKRSQLSHDIGVKELQWDLEIQRELKNAGVKEVQFAFLDKIKDNVELTKVQTANIDVKTSPQGHCSFNLADHLKNQSGANKARKDLYSAGVLLNWASKLYFDMQDVKKEAPKPCTFSPFII